MVQLVFLVLILCVSIGPASTEDDFMDIGVQLKGNNRDFLVADLIAEENDFFNAGHVSDRDGLDRIFMGLLLIRFPAWNCIISVFLSNTDDDRNEPSTRNSKD